MNVSVPSRIDALTSSYRSSFAWIVLAAGAILRLQGLGRQSLWMDELYSVQSSQSLADIWAFYQWDLHPPLYSLLLYGWISAFGDSEFTVRLLSALLGIATLLVIWILGKQKFGATVALGFLGLMAFSQRAIYFSQEARSYALLILLCTILTILWLPKMTGKDSVSRTNPTVLAAISILTGWTHYYGTIFVFSIWALLLFFRLLRSAQGLLWQWFLAGAMVFVACVGEFVFHNRFIAQSELPFHAELVTLWKDLPLFFFGTPFAIGAFLVLGVLLALWQWALPRRRLEHRDTLSAMAWLLGLCLVVGAAALLLNVFRNSFSARNLLVLLPAILLFPAMALGSLSGRFRSTWATLVCIAAFSQFLASAPWYWRGDSKQQWREASLVAGQEATDRSVVAAISNFDFQRSAIPAYDITGDAWGYYFQRSPLLDRLNVAGRIFQISPDELPRLTEDAARLDRDKVIVVRAHASDPANVAAIVEFLGRPSRHVRFVKSDVWIIDLK